VESDGAGNLAVVVGELDGQVNVELGELGNAGLAVKLLGLCSKNSASKNTNRTERERSHHTTRKTFHAL
jgi:hypothetical protein